MKGGIIMEDKIFWIDFDKMHSFMKDVFMATGDILRELRNSKKAPGEARIYTAGEKEYENWLYRKDKGVPVNFALQKDIIALKKKFNLTKYDLPFEEC